MCVFNGLYKIVSFFDHPNVQLVGIVVLLQPPSVKPARRLRDPTVQPFFVEPPILLVMTGSRPLSAPTRRRPDSVPGSSAPEVGGPTSGSRGSRWGGLNDGMQRSH